MAYDNSSGTSFSEEFPEDFWWKPYCVMREVDVEARFLVLVEAHIPHETAKI